MRMRECSECSKTKPLEEFPISRTSREGHRICCKTCEYSARKEYRRTPHARALRAAWKKGFSPTIESKKREKERKRLRREQNPLKHKAQNAIGHAIRTGKKIRATHCSQCGSSGEAIEGHHEDYSKPLDVVWLCRSCHRAKHPSGVYV